MHSTRRMSLLAITVALLLTVAAGASGTAASDTRDDPRIKYLEAVLTDLASRYCDALRTAPSMDVLKFISCDALNSDRSTAPVQAATSTTVGPATSTSTMVPVPTTTLPIPEPGAGCRDAKYGPSVAPGSAGMLTAANAPEGVVLDSTYRDVRLSDGAVLEGFALPEGWRVVVPGDASVTLDGVLGADTLVYSRSGSFTTIRDSELTNPLDASAWFVVQGAGSGVIEHSRLDGGEAATIQLASDSAGWIIRNNEIAGGEDGIKPYDRDHQIEGNWIHDPAVGAKLSSGEPRHPDGIQLSGFNANNEVRCNVIDATTPGANAAILIKPDLGTISDVTIERNLLSGGAYTLFSVVEGTSYALTDVAIADDDFGDAGRYGHTAIDNGATTLTGNDFGSS